MPKRGTGVCSECGADITHLHGLATTCKGECWDIRDRRRRLVGETRRRRENPEKFREQARVRTAADREHYRAKGREWYHANKDRARRNQRRKVYGAETPLNTPTECEVCGGSGRICFDHCHNTGQFRGWICTKCNSAAGLVGDNPETLRKLAVYLEKACDTNEVAFYDL